MTRFFIIILAAGALSVQAQERQIRYEQKILSFADWSSQYPQEKELLGLFRGYQEPNVTFAKRGHSRSPVARLTMYVTKTQLSINKPASSINLPGLISVETAQKLDKEISHKQIHPNELMTVTAGKGPVPNFKWCDKGYFNLPDYELPLTYLAQADHAWCSGSRAICLESCYPFKDALWYNAIQLHNGLKALTLSGPEEKKDYGVAMQSEMRYFTDESDYGMSVKSLTGVNTAVKGIIELNIFYINQVMQYGKIVAVFQEYPGNARQTVITSFAAIGIRTKTWNKYSTLQSVLKGTEGGINTETGLTAGIPVFTKGIATSLADILETQ